MTPRLIILIPQGRALAKELGVEGQVEVFG